MAAGAGLEVALALTLYRDALEDFLDVLAFAQSHPHLDRMLLTNYSQTLNSIPSEDDGLSLNNGDIYHLMAQKEKAWPGWYLPSSHDDKKFQWLFYTALVTGHRGGKVEKLYLHPAHPLGLKLIQRLNRMIFGRYRIEGGVHPPQLLSVIVLYTLGSFSPFVAWNMVRFLKRAYLNKNLKLFALVFQQSPTQLANGEFETCKDCPDATVRQGKIIPVCLVDRLEPLALQATAALAPFS
jgi:hypothetical protein